MEVTGRDAPSLRAEPPRSLSSIVPPFDPCNHVTDESFRAVRLSPEPENSSVFTPFALTLPPNRFGCAKSGRFTEISKFLP
jgi:hypothetical protein